MRARTRELVEEFLVQWVEKQRPVLERWVGAEVDRAYPFHRLIFSEDAIRAAMTERSIVTNMGDSLYPGLAEIVARDRFQDVALNRAIDGELNDAACNLIEQIVTERRAPRRGNPNPRTPNQPVEFVDIINSRGGGISVRSVTADLYVGDYTGGPLFVELKTPRPNLDIAAESKRKMLYFLTMMQRQGREGASAWLGLTYNPFGTREAYGHSFTRQIMDMDNEVLIGSDLWDHLGGHGTFAELLEIINEINPT